MSGKLGRKQEEGFEGLKMPEEHQENPSDIVHPWEQKPSEVVFLSFPIPIKEKEGKKVGVMVLLERYGYQYLFKCQGRLRLEDGHSKCGYHFYLAALKDPSGRMSVWETGKELNCPPEVYEEAKEKLVKAFEDAQKDGKIVVV
jgi:hypothetical protein